ncbi:MAG: ATP-binding cassette domain-containing protein, partial [Thermoplasmata archaeon]|nr:ATP-binding cassette domain-containing protein [Thermoplasmata archaeon]
VKHTYDGGIEALKGVNLNIRGGEYIAIVGGNGSGKTTLAKHMNGLLRPTGGNVELFGRDAARMTVAEMSKLVGYAFQNPDHQLFCATVDDELAFGPQNLGCTKDEVWLRVDYAVQTMGLQSIRKLPPLSLNLGQRRRISIASILAMDPSVLILDEPTTGLDLAESADLMAVIRKLNIDGRTIILITHEMKLVAEHANRVIVMANGRIVLDSDAKGAFSDLELLRQSRLAPPPISELAHRLSPHGVSRDIISPAEMVFELMRLRGGPR